MNLIQAICKTFRTLGERTSGNVALRHQRLLQKISRRKQRFKGRWGRNNRSTFYTPLISEDRRGIGGKRVKRPRMPASILWSKKRVVGSRRNRKIEYERLISEDSDICSDETHAEAVNKELDCLAFLLKNSLRLGLTSDEEDSENNLDILSLSRQTDELVVKSFDNCFGVKCNRKITKRMKSSFRKRKKLVRKVTSNKYKLKCPRRISQPSYRQLSNITPAQPTNSSSSNQLYDITPTQLLPTNQPNNITPSQQLINQLRPNQLSNITPIQPTSPPSSNQLNNITQTKQPSTNQLITPPQQPINKTSSNKLYIVAPSVPTNQPNYNKLCNNTSTQQPTNKQSSYQLSHYTPTQQSTNQLNKITTTNQLHVSQDKEAQFRHGTPPIVPKTISNSRSSTQLGIEAPTVNGSGTPLRKPNLFLSINGLREGVNGEMNLVYESVLRCAYFHPITRDVIDSKLTEDSMFLIRPSIQSQHFLTLSLKTKGTVIHIPIRLRSDAKFALGKEKSGEKAFSTISDMIENYRSEPIKFEDGSSTFLRCYPQ